MRRVRAIVTAHHQQKIHWDIEQFAQCILPLLRGPADCVEESEILLSKLRAVAIDNGLPNSPLHLFGLATQHCSLISYADRLKMHIRIESRRMRAFEFFQERLLVAAMADVVANVIGVCERQDYQVMAAA